MTRARRHMRGARQLRLFILAVQFLTRLRTPQIHDFRPEDLSRSAVFFPLVGVIVGTVIAALVWTFALVTPAVGALAGVIAWVWVTGGLHLDGLGDVADALGASHRDPQRFQEVLRDPHVGAFGVMAITLQIASKLVLLSALPIAASPIALVLVPAWARWGTLVWSRALASLSAGMAERFSWRIGLGAIGGWGAALTIVSAWACPALLVSLVVVLLIALYWQRRLGGISGDCLGASVEVMESVLLLAVAVAAAGRV